MDGYEVVQVPVDGGSLTVGRRGRGERTVLALHGLAGSFVAMSALGREFDEDEFTVLAPDLRGRGASNALPGPLEVVTIEDTNHLTIGTQPHATAQIARTIRVAAGLPR